MTQLTNTQRAWLDRQPVMGQLPEKGYKDNPVASFLTAYVDETLSNWADLLQNFHKALDPSTADPSYLDYIAYLFGLSGEPYWDVKWSTTVKRAILDKQAYLRKYKGTLNVIKTVLDIHGITYNLYVDGNLTMPFTFPGLMGTGLMRFFVLMPQNTSRTSTIWYEVVRTLKAYCPAVTQGLTAYRGFTLNLSHFGEPMFSSTIYSTVWTP